MKANLTETEPRLLARWEERRLYDRIRQARASSPAFVFHDGPPYANGQLHLGTAVNKILKDMVVKIKSMRGYNATFVPGWDCHGLPIEINVDKELGARKAGLAPLEVRQACRTYAEKFVDLHRRDFKRLGILAQWDRPYQTMSPDYEFVIADAFLTFLEKGYVYKGLKPVLWCWHDRTALAEAEIEYEMHHSPSVWVRYAVSSGERPARFPDKVFAVIWTTTPWTLPASMALAFHPQLRYAVVERETGELYLVAEDLASRVGKETGAKFLRQLGVWPGEELAKLQFRHPFLDRTVPAVLADYVNLEQGTGIVHTAPGHGAEDFETGLQYGIEVYCPVDDQGRITEGLDAYRGQQVFEANPNIVALLRQRGSLVGEAQIEHSYPHCWRCHNPLIFRATEQWFIRLDHRDLRKRALAGIKKVQWVPPWGEERIHAMIETRPDWCISRQRVWGVPITVFYCEECGEKFTDITTLRQVVQWFKREGADAWYRHAAEELLPQGTRCQSCGNTGFRKETDILDVWFDSGSSNLAVLDNKNGNRWPADLYLEGNDQYRGWFHSSLLVALGVRDQAPYRAVLTHGMVLDAEGRPMSKSLGNIIAPSEISEKYGADVLRLLTASVDSQGDMRIGPSLLDQGAEAYRKIRNTFRFCLSNLSDFSPQTDSIPLKEMEELDRWMLGRMRELVRAVREAYDAYAFHRAWHRIYDFCVVGLSATYFDILKDRLYTYAARSHGRRSAQTALYRIAHGLARLLAPIVSFTAEEVWEYLPATEDQQESVHLALLPAADEYDSGLPASTHNLWERLFAVRSEVLKALEQARQAKTIRGSLDAAVELRADGELGKVLGDYKAVLRSLFIVSAVELLDGVHPPVQQTGLSDLAIAVHPAEGKKCERCWNYSVHVGESSAFPTVCERCAPVLEELTVGGDRQ